MGLAHLGLEALGFALESGQAFFSLRGGVARVAGQGEEVHGAAAIGFKVALGVEDLIGGGAGFLLARGDFLMECASLFGRGLKEAVLLGALFNDAGELGAGLFDLRGSGGGARFQFGNALRVAAFAG